MPTDLLRFHLDPTVRAKGVEFSAPRAGDAGFDIRSAVDLLLEPGMQYPVPTGLRLAIPPGWVGIVKDRSSMALRQVYTHAGVIDAGYRGELKIVISNRGPEPQEFRVGDKIAQLVVVPCLIELAEAESIEALGVTERGAGGFGSTGRA